MWKFLALLQSLVTYTIFSFFPPTLNLDGRFKHKPRNSLMYATQKQNFRYCHFTQWCPNNITGSFVNNRSNKPPSGIERRATPWRNKTLICNYRPVSSIWCSLILCQVVVQYPHRGEVAITTGRWSPDSNRRGREGALYGCFGSQHWINFAYESILLSGK